MVIKNLLPKDVRFSEESIQPLFNKVEFITCCYAQLDKLRKSYDSIDYRESGQHRAHLDQLITALQLLIDKAVVELTDEAIPMVESYGVLVQENQDDLSNGAS